MLADNRTSFGAKIIDLYPFVDDELHAPFTARITVFDGEIRFQGNVWTPQDIQQIKDAFDTALAVAEAERIGSLPPAG